MPGIALGLNPLQRILYIILPTAFRASMPVLLTNGIVIFQQSALVAIVAVQDLMYQGKTLATETYRPIETFTDRRADLFRGVISRSPRSSATSNAAASFWQAEGTTAWNSTFAILLRNSRTHFCSASGRRSNLP